MRPVAVIVGHEDLEDPLKVLLIQDQQPIEALSASRSQVRTVVAETVIPKPFNSSTIR